MAWQAWKQRGLYDPTKPRARAWDPEVGLELTSKVQGGTGVTDFKITGPDTSIAFYGSLTEAPITDRERAEHNIPDAIVWCVFGGGPKSDRDKAIIFEAMNAFKVAYGFNPINGPVFVRFGKTAELSHG